MCNQKKKKCQVFFFNRKTSLFPQFNQYTHVHRHSYVLSHWFQKQLWSIVASYLREECVESGALNKVGSVSFFFFAFPAHQGELWNLRDRAPQSFQATKPSSVMHLPELALLLEQPLLLIVPVWTTSWSWCITDIRFSAHLDETNDLWDTPVMISYVLTFLCVPLPVGLHNFINFPSNFFSVWEECSI